MSKEMENLESFLSDFESSGAQLTASILDEGKYRASFVDLQIRYGSSEHKKGQYAGQIRSWNMWNARFELNSAIAQQKLKRDNAPVVYSDRSTEGFGNGTLNLCPFGIDSKENIGFWTFVGKLLHKGGLAEFSQDDSGEKTYKISPTVLRQMYAGTAELRDELLAAPDENNSHLVIEAKLAEKQLKNLSEMLASDSEVKKCYVHIQQRTNAMDSSKKEHFVKAVMLPDEFEANPSNVAMD